MPTPKKQPNATNAKHGSGGDQGGAKNGASKQAMERKSGSNK